MRSFPSELRCVNGECRQGAVCSARMPRSAARRPGRRSGAGVEQVARQRQQSTATAQKEGIHRPSLKDEEQMRQHVQ